MPIHLSGTAPYQLPVAKRVNFRPVALATAGDQGAALSPVTIGQAWVKGDQLHLSPPTPRDKNYNPQTLPLVILNENVDLNKRNIERGLDDLRMLRDNFLAQAATTTTVSGTLAGVFGAAGAGAIKGLAAGPKGAIIGSAVGASLNFAEVVRRRWNNGTTEVTLRFIDKVITTYQNVVAGRMTADRLLQRMLELKCESETVGPAARSAMAELELRFKDYNHPVFQALMSDYQVACSRKALTENRS